MTNSFPSNINIDLSSKCNLRCTFCHLSYFAPNETNKQISAEDFDAKFLPLLPHLESITLFSKYEVLTCRDFIPIFDRICEHGIETYFSTNGLLLSNEIIEAIVDRLKYLTISITGFTKDRYRKFMDFDGFEKLEANLDQLNKLKNDQKTPYPILRFSTVGMQDTLDELPSAIDFAKRHKAEEGVQFTSLYVYEPAKLDQLPAANIDRYNSLTDRAISYAKQKNVKLVLQSGTMEENSQATEAMGHKHCSLPWTQMSIQSNGDVYPCAVAYDPIGNIYEDTLEDIWQGELMVKFRLGVNDLENMNNDCRDCIHCRHRSISDVNSSDFSKSDELYGGLKRVNWTR
jgi:radical SAM protein with 4Fe4S-binding SPASM domain